MPYEVPPVEVEPTRTVIEQLAVPLVPVNEPIYVVVFDGCRLTEPDGPTLPTPIIAPLVARTLVQLSVTLLPAVILEALSWSLQVVVDDGVVVAVREKPFACAKISASGESRYRAIATKARGL